MRNLAIITLVSLALMATAFYLFFCTPFIISRNLPVYFSQHFPALQLDSFDIQGQRVAWPDTVILQGIQLHISHQGHAYQMSIDELRLPYFRTCLRQHGPWHLQIWGLKIVTDFAILEPREAYFIIKLLPKKHPQWKAIFRQASLSLPMLELQKAHGQITHEDNRWLLEDVTGRLFAAAANGSITIESDMPMQYHFDLQLQEVHPEQVPGLPALLKTVPGPLRSRVTYRGTRWFVDQMSLSLEVPGGRILNTRFIHPWIQQVADAATRRQLLTRLQKEEDVLTDHALFVLRDGANQYPCLMMDLVNRASDWKVHTEILLKRQEEQPAGRFIRYRYSY